MGGEQEGEEQQQENNFPRELFVWVFLHVLCGCACVLHLQLWQCKLRCAGTRVQSISVCMWPVCACVTVFPG